MAAFVVGTGNAFFQPALSGLPVQLAPRDQFGNANALFGMVQPAAQVAGPALAGIVIAAGSPAAAIAVDAGSYAVSAIALARLRFPDAERGPARSLLRDLADGWAEFSAHSWLWLQTLQFTLFNLLTWGPYLVLGPVLARDYLGGARAWGAILACYGGGAIIGGLLALGRRPRRPLLVSTVTTLGFPLPPLALALHLPVAAVAGGALLAGAGSAFGGAIATTVTQQRLPADVLSRVGSFNMVGAFAFGPLAFIAAGPVAAAFGVRAVLGFGAAWAVFGTLAVLAAPSIRKPQLARQSTSTIAKRTGGIALFPESGTNSTSRRSGPTIAPMAIDWNDEIVDQLESHWQQQLRPRLDGLTDDEYFWQPVPDCWTISRRGESSAPVSVGVGDFTIDSADEPLSPEPVTTIAWRLASLARRVRAAGYPHFDLSAGPAPEPRFPGTASEALRRLDEGHDAWLADVRQLGADGLTRPQGALVPAAVRGRADGPADHVRPPRGHPPRRRDLPASGELYREKFR